MANPSILSKDRLLVQIASYNTNLQGVHGLPQDLVDWLSPTLQVSKFLARGPRAPDVVAVGFQELLPLHLGFSGFSKSVIEDRNALILSQIEAHAPKGEKYSLVAKIVNVGVALLVYIRDDRFPRVADVQTQWTGSGPAYMGNKGAVGVRFRLAAEDGGIGETYTFVCAHLTAHEPRLANRIADYRHIVQTLLFPPVSSSSSSPTTMYSTSHLFMFGDLNFRLSLPKSHPLSGSEGRPQLLASLSAEAGRESLKEYDQLYVERKKGTVFLGLHEGEFWKFKCSYKYNLGEVDKYSTKRTPSWTDRILYGTYSDDLVTTEASNITNILYTTIPSYTTSDHKPILALLLLPAPNPLSSSGIPLLTLPSDFPLKPDPYATLKRYTGRSLDRIIGYIWWILTLIGAGSALVGLGNFIIGMGMWTFWNNGYSPPTSQV